MSEPVYGGPEMQAYTAQREAALASANATKSESAEVGTKVGGGGVSVVDMKRTPILCASVIASALVHKWNDGTRSTRLVQIDDASVMVVDNDRPPALWDVYALTHDPFGNKSANEILKMIVNGPARSSDGSRPGMSTPAGERAKAVENIWWSAPGVEVKAEQYRASVGQDEPKRTVVLRHDVVGFNGEVIIPKGARIGLTKDGEVTMTTPSASLHDVAESTAAISKEFSDLATARNDADDAMKAFEQLDTTWQEKLFGSSTRNTFSEASTRLSEKPQVSTEFAAAVFRGLRLMEATHKNYVLLEYLATKEPPAVPRDEEAQLLQKVVGALQKPNLRVLVFAFNEATYQGIYKHAKPAFEAVGGKQQPLTDGVIDAWEFPSGTTVVSRVHYMGSMPRANERFDLICVHLGDSLGDGDKATFRSLLAAHDGVVAGELWLGKGSRNSEPTKGTSAEAVVAAMEKCATLTGNLASARQSISEFAQANPSRIKVVSVEKVAEVANVKNVALPSCKMIVEVEDDVVDTHSGDVVLRGGTELILRDGVLAVRWRGGERMFNFNAEELVRTAMEQKQDGAAKPSGPVKIDGVARVHIVEADKPAVEPKPYNSWYTTPRAEEQPADEQGQKTPHVKADVVVPKEHLEFFSQAVVDMMKARRDLDGKLVRLEDILAALGLNPAVTPPSEFLPASDYGINKLPAKPAPDEPGQKTLRRINNLLREAIKHVDDPNHRALIVTPSRGAYDRRLRTQAHKLYEPIGGAEIYGELLWVFPSGAKVLFGVHIEAPIGNALPIHMSHTDIPQKHVNTMILDEPHAFSDAFKKQLRELIPHLIEAETDAPNRRAGGF